MSDYIEFYHYKNGGGRSAKSSNSGIVLDISHAWDSKRSKQANTMLKLFMVRLVLSTSTVTESSEQ